MYLHEVCIKDKPAKIVHGGYIYDWDGKNLRDGKDLVQFYVNLTVMDDRWEIIKPTLESVCKKYGYNYSPVTRYDAVYISTNKSDGLNSVYTDPDFPPEKLKKLLEVMKNV